MASADEIRVRLQGALEELDRELHKAKQSLQNRNHDELFRSYNRLLGLAKQHEESLTEYIHQLRRDGTIGPGLSPYQQAQSRIKIQKPKT